MKQIQLPLLQCEGASNQHLSVIINEVHGEYPMPQLQGVTINKIYSGYDTENILNHLDYPKNPKNLEANIQKVFDGIIRDYAKEANKSGIAFDQGDETMRENNLIRLTFWAPKTHEAMETLIHKYMEKLGGEIQLAMDEASGADTYYDYMPSFVDQYRQLCQYFKGPYIKIYNDLIKGWVAGEDDPNIYTETIE